MFQAQFVRTTLTRTGVLAGAVAVALGGLTACSTASNAGTANPPAAPSTSASTTSSDTRTTTPATETTTHTTKSASPTGPPRTTTTSSTVAPGNGFDGPAFQKAMNDIGVAPTGSTGGKGTKGIGVMYYKFTLNGSSIASINCTVQSEAADVQQSDQDAQTLGSTFFTACADFNFATDASAKSQASGFVTSNLAGLQGEQPPVTQTIGPVMLSLGKAAPGFYFLNMRH